MTKKTWTWFKACVGVKVQVGQYGLKARVSLQEKNVSQCNVGNTTVSVFYCCVVKKYYL